LRELDDNLDVAGVPLQGLVEYVCADTASHEPLEPRSVGSGQHLRRAIVVTAVGVDRPEPDQVLEHGVTGERRQPALRRDRGTDARQAQNRPKPTPGSGTSSSRAEPELPGMTVTARINASR
jgi:hypothetical protein